VLNTTLRTFAFSAMNETELSGFFSPSSVSHNVRLLIIKLAILRASIIALLEPILTRVLEVVLHALSLTALHAMKMVSVCSAILALLVPLHVRIQDQFMIPHKENACLPVLNPTHSFSRTLLEAFVFIVLTRNALNAKPHQQQILLLFARNVPSMESQEMLSLDQAQFVWSLVPQDNSCIMRLSMESNFLTVDHALLTVQVVPQLDVHNVLLLQFYTMDFVSVHAHLVLLNKS